MSDRDWRRPERRPEPEIIPPDRYGRAPGGQPRVFTFTTRGRSRVVLARPSAFSALLIGLLIGGVAMAALFLLFGAFIIGAFAAGLVVLGLILSSLFRSIARRLQ
jgi:hypothetical protein